MKPTNVTNNNIYEAIAEANFATFYILSEYDGDSILLDNVQILAMQLLRLKTFYKSFI